jgi:alcohol dehydrogenase class IV
MKFEFATAGRIVFGPGTWREAVGIARELGRSALLVTGRNLARAEPLSAALRVAGVQPVAFAVPGEPTTDVITDGIRTARAGGCDHVIAFGGGSAMDAGKAIAALLTNDGALLDYLEVIGHGQPLHATPAPCIAIPTTAGTGAEVTRNSVLASPVHRVKVSLRSPLMLPRAAIVDPELTLDLPADLTASTGLDALTQLIEPFLSCRANPLVDALCREGITRVARSLGRACQHPADLAAREDMALASLFGGLALANAGLGAVHGFAGPIGGMFPAPHGAVCAALLPHVLEMNARALRERCPGSEALRRCDELAHLLTGRPQASAGDGVRWIGDLVRELHIPGLRAHGMVEADQHEVVEKARQASSMKANPLPLTEIELAEIFVRAL